MTLRRGKKSAFLNGEKVSLAEKATITSIDGFDPRDVLNNNSKGMTCYEAYECTSRATGWEEICFEEVPCGGESLNDGPGGGDSTDYGYPSGGYEYPSGGGDGYDDGGNDEPTGGGGTNDGGGDFTNGNDPEEPDNTENTLPIAENDREYEVFNELDLTNNESYWLDNVATFMQREQIKNFLYENPNNQESEVFAEEAIRAWINDGEVDFETRLINNPWLHDFLKNRMSPNELALFENLSLVQKAAYLRAAAEAYTYAEIFYPQPVRNRKGDAVKHALWNALSTNYIGASLTKQLTDAHEEIDYDPDYPNHYKETDMDYYNNAKGRELATQYGSFIFQLVENALENGELRYLNHLVFLNGFYNATNSPQLTPTNQ